MIKGKIKVSRKSLDEDRIAICPHFGCKHLEKITPLKFGFLGFRKYPKCSKHKIPLVFVDEFISDFLQAVNACLFDLSSCPPEDLISIIKKKIPDELNTFIHDWIYCNPIGRGAQIVSQYMDGLSRGYMRLLSWKQKKTLKKEKSSKKRYNMLRLGLKKIADEYTNFLRELREKSELLYNPESVQPLSKDMCKLLKIWLKKHLIKIQSIKTTELHKSPIPNESLSVLKEEYDKILNAGTCTLLLGKSPSIVTKTISPFELFSAYHEFLKKGLCRELERKDVEILIEETKDFLKENEENLIDNQKNDKKDLITELDNMNIVYKTRDFVKDLKSELEKIISYEKLRKGRLSDSQLSLILGRNRNYIKDNLNRQLKRNPDYIISLEVLEGFETALYRRFGKKSKNTLKLFEKYRNLNQPPKSTKYQIYKHHPNFNINYFKIIDTKEKAYWLGFFSADGYREKMDYNKVRIGIEISIKDEVLINRFSEAIGFNLNYKEYRMKKLLYKGQIREYEHVCIRFINSKVAGDLAALGIHGSKSKRTNLPELNNHELNLAFLLGYYDGDGLQGTTKIVSGSKKILVQTKEKYDLPYKIIKHKVGQKWYLSLGSKLMNEMQANYRFSLPRKRKNFEERRYKVKDQFRALMNKDTLQKLVWEMPISDIAEIYEVWHHDVTDLCSEWNIKRPPQGYWN